MTTNPHAIIATKSSTSPSPLTSTSASAAQPQAPTGPPPWPVLQSPSPSTLDSAAASPRNANVFAPHELPLQARQLRNPKCPLYRPVALRQTERPVRQSPLTPPPSSSNSFESLKGSESPNQLSRRSTAEGSSSFLPGRWLGHDTVHDGTFGTLSGIPTREHWKISLLALSGTVRPRLSLKYCLTASLTALPLGYHFGV
ncbi:MAG: hypothetical protein M1817_001141 [Caeruleum heppii]|nr:MAG: hypothetical protein M1817_001141 [Caeruleum heppii]